MQTVKGEVFLADIKKAYRWYTHTTPLILNLILDEDEWSTSCPGHFSPRTECQPPTESGGWSVPEPGWTFWRMEKSRA